MKVNYIAKIGRKLDLNSNSSYLVMGSHLWVTLRRGAKSKEEAAQILVSTV
jgi:hypothetical protein